MGGSTAEVFSTSLARSRPSPGSFLNQVSKALAKTSLRPRQPGRVLSRRRKTRSVPRRETTAVAVANSQDQ